MSVVAGSLNNTLYLVLQSYPFQTLFPALDNIFLAFRPKIIRNFKTYIRNYSSVIHGADKASLRKHPSHVALASFPSGDYVWLQNSSEAHLAPPPLPSHQHSPSAAKGSLIQSSAKRVTRLRCVIPWSEVVYVYEVLVRSSWNDVKPHNGHQMPKSPNDPIGWVTFAICWTLGSNFSPETL
jgi:hypothetical protein